MHLDYTRALVARRLVPACLLVTASLLMLIFGQKFEKRCYGRMDGRTDEHTPRYGTGLYSHIPLTSLVGGLILSGNRGLWASRHLASIRIPAF